MRQAHKYRELAGARGVQVVQLETELSSLKTTVKNLRRLYANSVIQMRPYRRHAWGLVCVDVFELCT